MKFKNIISFIILISFSCISWAKEADNLRHPFSWGGGFRLQLNNPKDIPIEAEREDGRFLSEARYSQLRTQLWVKYIFTENSKIKVKILNEFRQYDSSKSNNKNMWGFVDEFIFDELYFDLNNKFNGKVNFRIGRQTLYYGSGKIIAEGTPADGSRSIYNNAIKSVVQISKNNSLDFFYFNNQKQDVLAINSMNRDLVEWPEDGFGIYGENQSLANNLFEYYYVLKNERRSGINGKPVQINTFGMRYVPLFKNTLKANIELAGQFGKQGDVSKQGVLFDGQIDWQFSNNVTFKPQFSLGYYFLTGDDVASTTNEAWTPVLSRWPQYSSLYLLSYIDGAGGRNAGSWSDLSMPWIGLILHPCKDIKLKLKYSFLHANKIDIKNYPTLGNKRGDLLTANLTYQYDKQWSGLMFFELFNPGNYYKDSVPNGHYIRGEIKFNF